ncbi:unnamed protein product, partial [Protopolystoma xenopodis]
MSRAQDNNSSDSRQHPIVSNDRTNASCLSGPAGILIPQSSIRPNMVSGGPGLISTHSQAISAISNLTAGNASILSPTLPGGLAGCRASQTLAPLLMTNGQMLIPPQLGTSLQTSVSMPIGTNANSLTSSAPMFIQQCSPATMSTVMSMSLPSASIDSTVGNNSAVPFFQNMPTHTIDSTISCDASVASTSSQLPPFLSLTLTPLTQAGDFPAIQVSLPGLPLVILQVLPLSGAKTGEQYTINVPTNLILNGVASAYSNGGSLNGGPIVLSIAPGSTNPIPSSAGSLSTSPSIPTTSNGLSSFPPTSLNSIIQSPISSIAMPTVTMPTMATGTTITSVVTPPLIASKPTLLSTQVNVSSLLPSSPGPGHSPSSIVTLLGNKRPRAIAPKPIRADQLIALSSMATKSNKKISSPTSSQNTITMPINCSKKSMSLLQTKSCVIAAQNSFVSLGTSLGSLRGKATKRRVGGALATIGSNLPTTTLISSHLSPSLSMLAGLPGGPQQLLTGGQIMGASGNITGSLSLSSASALTSGALFTTSSIAGQTLSSAPYHLMTGAPLGSQTQPFILSSSGHNNVPSSTAFFIAPTLPPIASSSANEDVQMITSFSPVSNFQANALNSGCTSSLAQSATGTSVTFTTTGSMISPFPASTPVNLPSHDSLSTSRSPVTSMHAPSALLPSASGSLSSTMASVDPHTGIITYYQTGPFLQPHSQTNGAGALSLGLPSVTNGELSSVSDPKQSLPPPSASIASQSILGIPPASALHSTHQTLIDPSRRPILISGGQITPGPGAPGTSLVMSAPTMLTGPSASLSTPVSVISGIGSSDAGNGTSAGQPLMSLASTATGFLHPFSNSSIFPSSVTACPAPPGTVFQSTTGGVFIATPPPATLSADCSAAELSRSAIPPLITNLTDSSTPNVSLLPLSSETISIGLDPGSAGQIGSNGDGSVLQKDDILSLAWRLTNLDDDTLIDSSSSVQVLDEIGTGYSNFVSASAVSQSSGLVMVNGMNSSEHVEDELACSVGLKVTGPGSHVVDATSTGNADLDALLAAAAMVGAASGVGNDQTSVCVPLPAGALSTRDQIDLDADSDEGEIQLSRLAAESVQSICGQGLAGSGLSVEPSSSQDFSSGAKKTRKRVKKKPKLAVVSCSSFLTKATPCIVSTISSITPLPTTTTSTPSKSTGKFLASPIDKACTLNTSSGADIPKTLLVQKEKLSTAPDHDEDNLTEATSLAAALACSPEDAADLESVLGPTATGLDDETSEHVVSDSFLTHVLDVVSGDHADAEDLNNLGLIDVEEVGSLCDKSLPERGQSACLVPSVHDDEDVMRLIEFDNDKDLGDSDIAVDMPPVPSETEARSLLHDHQHNSPTEETTRVPIAASPNGPRRIDMRQRRACSEMSRRLSRALRRSNPAHSGSDTHNLLSRPSGSPTLDDGQMPEVDIDEDDFIVNDFSVPSDQYTTEEQFNEALLLLGPPPAIEEVNGPNRLSDSPSPKSSNTVLPVPEALPISAADRSISSSRPAGKEVLFIGPQDLNISTHHLDNESRSPIQEHLSVVVSPKEAIISLRHHESHSNATEHESISNQANVTQLPILPHATSPAHTNDLPDLASSVDREFLKLFFLHEEGENDDPSVGVIGGDLDGVVSEAEAGISTIVVNHTEEASVELSVIPVDDLCTDCSADSGLQIHSQLEICSDLELASNVDRNLPLFLPPAPPSSFSSAPASLTVSFADPALSSGSLEENRASDHSSAMEIVDNPESHTSNENHSPVNIIASKPHVSGLEKMVSGKDNDEEPDGEEDEEATLAMTLEAGLEDEGRVQSPPILSEDHSATDLTAIPTKLYRSPVKLVGDEMSNTSEIFTGPFLPNRPA